MGLRRGRLELLFQDTSPPGAGIEGEENHWHIGAGGGFRLHPTNPAYAMHYNALTHVTKELPQFIAPDELELPIDWISSAIP